MPTCLGRNGATHVASEIQNEEGRPCAINAAEENTTGNKTFVANATTTPKRPRPPLRTAWLRTGLVQRHLTGKRRDVSIHGCVGRVGDNVYFDHALRQGMLGHVVPIAWLGATGVRVLVVSAFSPGCVIIHFLGGHSETINVAGGAATFKFTA